ncbi:hypothetical protein NW762_014266 [Fusarium torreyae]|uniref:Chromo domain-containing protein n=1 Tax=Fusarium torreyae TaxID=1237075 RepID=A0A9W8V9K9_9HYPO|nr:hypothetical protein NW762_014266 [Fusarium torreyae]
MPLQPSIESPDPEDNRRPDDSWLSKAEQSSRPQPSSGQMLPPPRPQSQATGSNAGPSSQPRPRNTGTPMDRGPRDSASTPTTPAPKGLRKAARRTPSMSLTPGPNQGHTSAVRDSGSRPSDGHSARRGSAGRSSLSRGANDDLPLTFGPKAVEPTPERELTPHDHIRRSIQEQQMINELLRQQVNKTIYSEEKYPIARVKGWKICDEDEDSIELLIQWDDGTEDTWEPEEIIQEDAESLVYAFWKEHGGRQRTTKLLNYHAFKILKTRATKDPKKPEFLVQWVGYPPRKPHTAWRSYDVVYENSKPQYIEYVLGYKMW